MAAFSHASIEKESEIVPVYPTVDAKYKVAIDLGSTTIVCYLLTSSLAAEEQRETGKQRVTKEKCVTEEHRAKEEKDYRRFFTSDDTWRKQVIAVESTLNPQAVYGKDVISRISYIGHDRERLGQMQRMVVEQCEKLLLKMFQQQNISIGEDTLEEIVVAGNPTMCHILLGYLPESLAAAPFSHAYQGSVRIKAGDIGFCQLTDVSLYVLPSISHHVGADTVSAMCDTLYKQSGVQLLIDIGTNGELVLQNGEKYYACSAAAGPVLEGGAISQGMIAENGAIHEVNLTGNKEIDVRWIGQEKTRAKGICGSGLLDAIAVLCNIGIIEANGTFIQTWGVNDQKLSYGIKKRLIDYEGERAFVLYIENETLLSRARGQSELFEREVKEGKIQAVILKQSDIRNVQLAKAAIYAAIFVMLKAAGIRSSDVDKIYLAGAFGNYMRVESAIRIGLLPGEWRDKIVMTGNAAGEGTCKVALCEAIREWAEKIPETVYHLPLGQSKLFQEYYIQAMNFEPPDMYAE